MIEHLESVQLAGLSAHGGNRQRQTPPLRWTGNRPIPKTKTCFQPALTHPTCHRFAFFKLCINTRCNSDSKTDFHVAKPTSQPSSICSTCELLPGVRATGPHQQIVQGWRPPWRLTRRLPAHRTQRGPRGRPRRRPRRGSRPLPGMSGLATNMEAYSLQRRDGNKWLSCSCWDAKMPNDLHASPTISHTWG